MTLLKPLASGLASKSCMSLVDATLLTNTLPASSFNSLNAEPWWHHSESSQNACHRKWQVKYIWTRLAHFSASYNLRFSVCLFHIKSLYVCTRVSEWVAVNVEPDKISRIMYLIMFWSVTSRWSNGKWAIAWEKLSFEIGFTEEASGSADPEIRTHPPGNSQVLY